jgi:hypothetical protein
MIVTGRIAVRKKATSACGSQKKNSQQRMPFATSSVRLRRMSKFFPKTRPESVAGVALCTACAWQGAKMLTKDDLSWKVPAAEMARDGLMVRCGGRRPPSAARMRQRLCSDVQAERIAGLPSGTIRHPSPPFLGPEVADFCPVTRIRARASCAANGPCWYSTRE